MSASLESYRALFPAVDAYNYLNHAGVAPTSTHVRAAILRWVDDLVAHGIKNEERWEEDAERVRALAGRLLGCAPTEVAFVRNTSHGLGLVAEGLAWQPGDEVAVCTALEYPSNVYPWQLLARRGVRLVEVPAVRDGVRPDAVLGVLTDRTRLLAVSSAQYTTGHRSDLAALGQLCRERDILLCVDGIQTLGAVPIDVHAAGIDFLAADSHKWLLGLPGIGVLFVSQRVIDRLHPVIVGWKSTADAWDFDRVPTACELRSDASKLEEGSPSYAGICGLGAAIELLTDVGVDRVHARIRAWVDRAAIELAALGCDVSPDPDERAGILVFRPPGENVEALAATLTDEGIVLSCRRGRIRASPHFYTTDAELDQLVDVVRDTI